MNDQMVDDHPAGLHATSRSRLDMCLYPVILSFQAQVLNGMLLYKGLDTGMMHCHPFWRSKNGAVVFCIRFI